MKSEQKSSKEKKKLKEKKDIDRVISVLDTGFVEISGALKEEMVLKKPDIITSLGPGLSEISTFKREVKERDFDLEESRKNLENVVTSSVSSENLDSNNIKENNNHFKIYKSEVGKKDLEGKKLSEYSPKGSESNKENLYSSQGSQGAQSQSSERNLYSREKGEFATEKRTENDISDKGRDRVRDDIIRMYVKKDIK